MNYTYYLKLVDISKLPKYEMNLKIKNEKLKVEEDIEDSYWGITVAQNEYLKYLEILYASNNSKFRKIKLHIFLKTLKKNFDKKIRAVFFCYEYQTFPTFQSIYELLRNSDKFICELVHVPFYHVDKEYNEEIEIKDYIANGYKNIIKSSEYKLNESSPDIAFFLKPYDLIPKEYYIDEIKKVIDKIIYIPYGMEIGATKESMRYQYQLPLHDNAWMCISYCNKHYERAKKYSSQKGKNYYLIGHPRMDLVTMDFSNDETYKSIKQKANGRKIFMYNPHFTIDDGDNWGTFKLYGIDILEYFSKNKDVFLLFRPHPFLEMALKKSYEKEKLKKMEAILKENSDNIYVDTNGNYLISMHVSDVLISDANSFVPEYLIYNKPIIYTKKPKTTGFKNLELEKLLYVSKTSKQIIGYIENLKNGNDPLKKNREKMVKQIFKYDKEKSVANKIYEFIINYYQGELK